MIDLDKLILRNVGTREDVIIEATDGINTYTVEPNGPDEIILRREGEDVRLQLTNGRFEVVE